MTGVGEARTGGPARQPAWSGSMTDALAKLVPPQHRNEALWSIRAIHTAISVSIAGAVLLTLWDGMRGRPRRRTAIAGGVVLAEAGLYVSNNQVCPLTPLAEQLGADRGAVVDLFLPAWAARQIPVVAGSTAVVALALNVRAWREHSRINA